MKGGSHKIFHWVLGTHAAVLFLLILIPWAKSLLRPVPKEIITYISVESAPAPVSAVQAITPPTPPKPEPKPEPEPAPKPEPKPEPEPAPKPEPKPKIPEPKPIPKTPKPAPPKTNAPPPKVTAPKATPPKTPAPKPTAPSTATKKPATVQKQTTRKVVTEGGTPSRTSPDLSGIKAALQSGAASSSGASGTFSPFAWYYDSVKQHMYSAWQQPAGAPVGLTATAVIRVESGGAVSSRSLVRRSGNPEFDRSVQAALDAVTHLPAPPADLPDRSITIEFVLSR